MDLLRMLLQVTLVVAMAAPTSGEAKLGCNDTCGNVSIPYPFGTRSGCYYDDPSFLISCNIIFDPPKPFLGDSNVEVTNISLDGQLQIMQYIARDCYNQSGIRIFRNLPWITLSKFKISSTRNKFTAIGCDTRASIGGQKDGKNYLCGCSTRCESIDYVANGSCSGIGCCQTSIPTGVAQFSVQLQDFNSHDIVWNFSKCSYAFVVQEDKFNFSSYYLSELKNVEKLPVVVDWAIGYETSCEIARKSSKYACKANNSNCYEVDFGPGYRCNCSQGYHGNPYLPDGCKDINECNDHTLNQCENNCENTVGSYTCSCPKGYHGDARKDGRGCIPDLLLVIEIVLGAGMGLLVLIVGCCSLRWVMKRRQRQKNFKQNGGLILRQELLKLDGAVEEPPPYRSWFRVFLSTFSCQKKEKTAKIFSLEELKKATNDFDKDSFVGEGGFGTLYRGVLPKTNETVAIKKSSVVLDEGLHRQFANEFIVLSQIKQENVVKLLGCCLEGEGPILVYEFIGNGSLSQHIHKGSSKVIQWEDRIRIAKETAKALSYLHFDVSIKIIHRDVKSTNILLDDNLMAKVSDFGSSRIVPKDKKQLQTMVVGTLGYLDPEYIQTNELTEKSDVYSFGVVLAELLTGRMAVLSDGPEEGKLLSDYFISSMNKNRPIWDDQIENESNAKQILEVANLARLCLALEGGKRPTMREVTDKLDRLVGVEKHGSTTLEGKPEEIDHLLGKSFDWGTPSSSTTVG